MTDKPKRFSDLNIKIEHKKFVGEKVRLAKILNTEITIHDYYIKPSKYPKNPDDKFMCLQISIDGKKHISFTIAKGLMQSMEKVNRDDLPFITTIRNDNDVYEFT